MHRSLEKGYEKFSAIGKNAWLIINALTQARDDLYCFVLTHSDTDLNGRSKCKTIGKMLDDKICIEGMFTVELHSLISEEGYTFLTQNDGIHIAKSPFEMFASKFISNDLNFVRTHLKDYFELPTMEEEDNEQTAQE